MKQISYLLFLLLVSCSLGWKLPEDRDAAKSFFKYWKEEHGKIYKNDAEEEKRIGVFAENMKFINKLNDKYRPETMFYINQYADMSPKEFREKILMPKRQPPAFETKRYIMGNEDDPLPDSFDWTEKNMVTEIKDQGDGGTCWAFSTIGNIEGQWAMKGQQLTNFSVEQIVDCDGMEDVKGNHADCGVFGGWPYLAYQYVMKAGGLETWENYTYCSGLGGAPGTCEVCPAPGYNNSLCGPPIPYCNMSQSCVTKLDPAKFHPGLKVQDWRAIVENETIIAQQLMKVGPLSVALNAELLQFYHRGVFNPITCNPKNLDHAVLLVGFGKEKILFKEEYYWKVKNSWGVKWGEKGYFRIKRGAGTCGINTQVTTAILADV